MCVHGDLFSFIMYGLYMELHDFPKCENRWSVHNLDDANMPICWMFLITTLQYQEFLLLFYTALTHFSCSGLYGVIC